MLCVLGGVGAEHANGHCAEALAVRTAHRDFHIVFKDSMSQVSAPDRLALPETCGPLLCMFASVPSSLWGALNLYLRWEVSTFVVIFRLFLVCVRARVSCTLTGFSHTRVSHPEDFQGLELTMSSSPHSVLSGKSRDAR